jgi:hypothetical protein
MRITIVPEDKTIGIDGEFILNMSQDISWIDSNIHAVQWYDTWGEIEYKDGSQNEIIQELGIYQQAIVDYNNEKQSIEDEKIRLAEEAEAARDYWGEFRELRYWKLQGTDWTQLPDVDLTEEKKLAWREYRQALRDLPENITDPKPLVLDVNHPDWTANMPQSN